MIDRVISPELIKVHNMTYYTEIAYDRVGKLKQIQKCRFQKVGFFRYAELK